MKKKLLILGAIILGVFFLIGLTKVGMIALHMPQTYVISGKQIPQSYHEVIDRLELNAENEEIVYFYSDGLMKPEEGMYFVTETQLVIYVESWEEASTWHIRFEEIVKLDIDRSNSLLEDSWFNISFEDGGELMFPISIEKGGDKKFEDFIRARMRKVNKVTILENE